MYPVTRLIPNTITLLNLTAGVMAIICALGGVDAWWGLKGWQWGAIFVGIGAVSDFFDGFSARIFKAYSALGKELDSLSDLVSFGVAPMLLVFNVLDAAGAEEWLKWCMLPLPAVAALRLARFNIDTRQTTYFIGMPVPANAIFWIGFCALVTSGTYFLILPTIFLPVVAVEAWLMVSPFKMLSLKFHDYKFKGTNLWRYLLILTAAALVFCMGVGGLMWLIVFYVVLSLCVGVKS